jgi:predicted MPP superfamily phosphohydrolase
MTAQLQIVSDVHLEHGARVNISKHAPYIALVGDIGAPFQSHYADFLAAQSSQFDKVFVILGNHEYYGSHTPAQIEEKVKSICESLPNVVLLQRDTYRLPDATVLIGCTLWSELDPIAAPRLNDLKRITIRSSSEPYRKKKLDLHTYVAWHKRDVSFIEQALQKHADDRVIVLTHHAPTHRMQGQHSGSIMCSAFATPLEHLMKAPVVAWVSGHVHSNVDTMIHGVRSVSNCMGYSGEEAGYREDVIV